MPSAEAIASSHSLQNLIKEEIQTHHGWIPFSRFMELALYAPQFGYYTGGSHKIGRAGDFITAPTLTPLFAQTLAQQLNTLLPQTAGNIYEFGAGTGVLASDLLNALGDGVQNYYIIELSSELANRQHQYIQQNAPQFAHKVQHLSQLPQTFDGILIGNEVLDAMPVERIQLNADGIEQVGVSWEDNQFVWRHQTLHQAEMLDIVHRYFPQVFPYCSEIHPRQYAFIQTLAERLQRGGMIWIDYGFDASQYYHPQRNEGTLIGHHQHHTIHNPFYRIGLTDLTAHVNFTDIAQAGVDAGLDLIGYTSQGNFLLNLGITNLLHQIGESESPQYIQAVSAVQQLIGQHEMGELFKVMAFGKNINIDWQGFQFGDICHKL